MNWKNPIPRGMRTFSVIWFGQTISLLGTGMTRFALIIWAYQQTEQATTIAMLGFFSWVTLALFSPIAGVYVDRWDRRLVMLGADVCTGVVTLGVLSLYATGNLQIWHLYISGALTGVFEAFQYPAYTAATTMLVEKKHYTRVSGMRSLSISLGQAGAPFIAGALLVFIGITGVLVLDVVTFVASTVLLLLVRVPPTPKVVDDDPDAAGNTLRQMRFGFRYIVKRRGLLGLVVMMFGINFFAALTYFSILPAMILARTGGDQLALAWVEGALGVGGVVGGVLVSLWSGTRRKIHIVLSFTALSFLLGDVTFAVGRNVVAWAIAAFVAAVFIPFIVAAHRAIWQAKVEPGAQGRVFAVQGMFEIAALPFGYIVTGPLADRLLEPAMMPGGSLSETFGWLVGTGPGAGMALMFVGTGIFGALMGFSGYLIPAVRNVERDLPDFEMPKDDPVGVDALPEVALMPEM